MSQEKPDFADSRHNFFENIKVFTQFPWKFANFFKKIQERVPSQPGFQGNGPNSGIFQEKPQYFLVLLPEKAGVAAISSEIAQRKPRKPRNRAEIARKWPVVWTFDAFSSENQEKTELSWENGHFSQ